MEITMLGIEQLETGETVLTAAGHAVVGVEGMAIGGDDKGSYIDIRVRQYRIGPEPEVEDAKPGPDAEEAIDDDAADPTEE